MEGSLERSTRPTYKRSESVVISSNENASESPERMEEVRVQVSPQRRTPSHALVDFDGNVQVVRAHEIVHMTWCGKQTLVFWAHTLALMMAMVSGLTMMILHGTSSPDFAFWSAMFSLGIGGFLPQPKLKNAHPSGGAAVG